MKPLPLALACLLSCPAFAQASSTPASPPPATTAPAGIATVDSPDTQSVRQIEAVIEAFRTAIIDKDKARFAGLFLHDSITWQDVTGDASLQRIREQRPEATKVRVDLRDNPLSFIDGIVSDPDRSEEKFRNVRIDTDGDIASVHFDYSFHSNDRETNHGEEAWHLVRTDDGWKIASVIWSMNASPPAQ